MYKINSHYSVKEFESRSRHPFIKSLQKVPCFGCTEWAKSISPRKLSKHPPERTTAPNFGTNRTVNLSNKIKNEVIMECTKVMTLSPANGGPTKLPIPWHIKFKPYAAVNRSRSTRSTNIIGMYENELAKNRPKRAADVASKWNEFRNT